MDGIISSVDGADILVEIIRTQPEKKRYKIQRMLQASADKIEANAASDAPERSGDLKGSGHVEPFVASEDEIAFDVTFGDGASGGTYDYGGYEADGYAWFQELGTSKMEAQPYLYHNFYTEAMNLQDKLAAMFEEPG